MLGDEQFQKNIPDLLRFLVHGFETGQLELDGIYFENKGKGHQELWIIYDFHNLIPRRLNKKGMKG